jgi:hypothetical protein
MGAKNSAAKFHGPTNAHSISTQLQGLKFMMATSKMAGMNLAELFGPGHFVGLGLRLKSEIRTRT